MGPEAPANEASASTGWPVEQADLFVLIPSRQLRSALWPTWIWREASPLAKATLNWL